MEQENVRTQLCHEIRQIYEQYLREVPSRRRAWPESIRSRVVQLWQLGVSCNRIANETGISVKTLYSWKAKNHKSQFLSVPLVASSPSTEAGIRSKHIPTEQSQPQHQTQSLTLAVRLPSGMRIEGLNLEMMFAVVEHLEQRRGARL